MKLLATLVSLFSVLATSSLASNQSSQLYVMEAKRNMGVIATQDGDRVHLVYNYRIRFEGSQKEQAIWKSAHNLQTQEEYVCAKNSRECVNTKYKELKLTRSKDGHSIKVVGPAGLIDYTFVQYKGALNIL